MMDCIQSDHKTFIGKLIENFPQKDTSAKLKIIYVGAILESKEQLLNL